MNTKCLEQSDIVLFHCLECVKVSIFFKGGFKIFPQQTIENRLVTARHPHFPCMARVPQTGPGTQVR